jgi:hypothetical protein
VHFDLRVATRRALPVAMLLVAAACTDGQPTGPTATAIEHAPRLQMLDCTASVASATVSCSRGVPAGGPNLAILGGQNDYIRLQSSNVTAEGGLFQFEVTVQNLLPEAIGTPNGVVLDTAGISVFFSSGPTVTAGTGTVFVANADGTGEFNGPNQPFFRYAQKLSQDEVSASRTWQLVYDPGVQTFTFRVYVAAELQPLLVINEILVNPGGTISDANGEWFEVYNAGRLPVQMKGMLLADSNAAGGRRAYHQIGSSLVVQPGAYVVLGKSANTTDNGGVQVDYAYGVAMSFENSVDALKISRATSVAGDTLTLDRVQYASAATSAQNGVGRELKNPALDNSNVDGSNWDTPSVTAVYGPGGRGTPKAQNSTYTP